MVYVIIIPNISSGQFEILIDPPKKGISCGAEVL